MDTLHYYFTISSPWAYFGDHRMRRIADCYNLYLDYKPIDLVKLLSKTGGQVLENRSSERKAYRLIELERWRRHLRLPLNLQPKYLQSSDTLANKLVIACTQLAIDPTNLAYELMRAFWVKDQDITNPVTLRNIIVSQSLNPTQLMNRAQDSQIADLLDFHTDEAISRGVFGVPSYVIGDEIFWGQDRLELLDQKLTPRSDQNTTYIKQDHES